MQCASYQESPQESPFDRMPSGTGQLGGGDASNDRCRRRHEVWARLPLGAGLAGVGRV